VGVPLSDALASLATLRNALILGVLGGTLLAGALALLLAGRATRPIARIARTAEAIRSGARPFQRIDYRGRDELGALASVLDASFAELEEALERQRRFGADASHELRTPVAAIRANVDLLRGWATTEPAARETALASLDQASRRAARLVEDLLYLATLEREPTRPRAPVRLDELILGVVREVGGLRPDIAIRVAKLDEATIDGDRLALQQLLLNLLDNALSVSPVGAEVDVALSGDGDRAIITVTDSGPGIPPDELTRIFDRFYSKKAGSERGASAGLGLSIARAIAIEHGGELVACNQPAGGARFALTLPLALTGTAEDPAQQVIGAGALPAGVPGTAASHRNASKSSA
jgi:signal transduction histidine kinase